MGLGAYLVRSEVRRRWRSILLTALLIALVTGTVLTAVAGARRTRTAFDRYLATVDGVDLVVMGAEDEVQPGDFASVDGVETTIDVTWYAAFPEDMGDAFYPMFVPEDRRVPEQYLHPPLVAGRRPDLDDPLEVNLGERTARRLHVGVGDGLAMFSFAPDEVEVLTQSSDVEIEPTGPTFELEVVGLVRTPGDIAARETDLDVTILPPAFMDEYGEAIGVFASGTMIVVEENTDPESVAAAVGELGEYEIETTFGDSETREPVDPTLGAVAIGLYLFAAIAGLVGLVAIAQVLSRTSTDMVEDHTALRGLGIVRRTLWLRITAPGLVAVAVGVPAGALASVLASSRLPFGLAGRAEPDPGIAIDPLVTIGGGVVLAVVFSGLALVTAVVVSRRARAGASARPSRVADWLATRGSPIPVATGVRLALDSGRAGRAVPVRAAIAATIAAVAGVLAATIVGASISHAVTTPSVYGWAWDAMLLGADSDHLTDGQVDEQEVLDDSAFTAVAELINDLEVTVAGRPENAVVLEDLRGHTPFVMARGEEPRQPDEVALGASTLSDSGLSVGDSVRVGHGDEPEQTMRIVGVVALPVSEDGGSSARGLVMTRAAADSLGFSGNCDDDASCSRKFVLTGAPDTDVEKAAKVHADRGEGADVMLPTPPPDVERLTAVESLPTVMAAVLGIIGVVAIAHAAATTVRRRRRDLAILRVLGYTGSQLRRSIAVQVLTLATIGALLGTALGVLVGRQVWARIADAVSVPSVVDAPPAALVGVPIAALLVAHLSATRARHAAGKVHPAEVLHTE